MEHEYNKEAILLSPWRLVVRLLIVIFSVEAVIMFLLATLFGHEHGVLTSIADAAMLVILSAPFLWYFIVHPLRRAAIAEHLQAATIIEHSNDGIITSNEAGIVESFNPAAQRIFGFKAEEVLDKPMVQLMPERYRDAHQQGLKRAELAGKPSLLEKTIELHGLRRDGCEFPLELSLSAWKTGRKVRYAGFIRDITERRRAEAEIQSRTVLLEQANRNLERQKEIQELLKELSQDITRLDVDSLLKKLTERVREVLKVDICDVRVRDDEVWKVMGVSGIDPKKTQSDSTATARGRSRWILDNRRPLLIHDITKTDQYSGGESIRKAGVRGYIGVPIFSRGGDVIGILRALTYEPRETSPEEVDLLQLLANGTGIALENAKLLEHIRQQAQTLEQVNRQQADFTAMIAHDLRSPLQNVIGIAEMMKDDMLGPVNEEQKKWLGKLGVSVRNLVKLVNEFLDLSKLEAGHIELDKEEVDLRELIESNLESYRLLGRDKKIIFTSSLDPDLPTADADPRRLDQVLSNLLSNAVKFTPEGGQIEVGARAEDSRAVNFWVRDTGIGIPKEEIGNLFEKYKQASNTKNGSQNGTGLGLVICKMIVETHGGRIWIDSEENKGTTVFVSLPVLPGS
ncbi:MAG: ATP-binding protein, partial [Candidatus Binatia bacterium]|nr:ATP-binding protein [Candidatus Binatia bacterium]